MANQENIVVTETSADGTETKVEITATNENEETIVEEVFEALMDAEESNEVLEDVYEPELDSGDNTFHRSDNTDIGTGSDGETTYVIGEDFSYID